MWPEIPPVEPFESGIEELTGVRPYKGTLMYYRQLGVYDPYEGTEAAEPELYPGHVRASDHIYYLEQSHHKALPARHTLQGQRVVANNVNTFRPQPPRKQKQFNKQAPLKSRELLGPPRPGRATELFQQGRVRADHHVVDESNVCPVSRRPRFKFGPRFTLAKTPWEAASDSFIGDPRDAFQEIESPPRERLSKQPPVSKQYTHPSEPRLGYSEMDYARPPVRSPGRGGISQMYHAQPQQPVQTSDTWKGGSGRPGQSFKRFHSGVVPYETDFNRKASGWQSNYFHEEPTDFIFAQDDFDAPGSRNRGGGGGGAKQVQYGDYNARPKTWQGGQQEPEEEPYVPLQQRRQTFEQEDQSQYYQQQQEQEYQQQQYQQQQQQEYHQPQQRHPQQAQRQRQPQRQHPQQQQQPRRQHQAPRSTGPKPQGRGSAAHHAGPQPTRGGQMYESDDL